MAPDGSRWLEIAVRSDPEAVRSGPGRSGGGAGSFGKRPWAPEAQKGSKSIEKRQYFQLEVSAWIFLVSGRAVEEGSKPELGSRARQGLGAFLGRRGRSGNALLG